MSTTFSYVDRGVDAPDFLDLDDSDSEPLEDAPFEPVLPFNEDLMIYLSDDPPSELLNS